MNNAIIDKIYEDNNYPGLTKLIQLVKKDNPSITKSEIEKWYNGQLEIQLLHQKQKADASGHIVAF